MLSDDLKVEDLISHSSHRHLKGSLEKREKKNIFFENGSLTFLNIFPASTTKIVNSDDKLL